MNLLSVKKVPMSYRPDLESHPRYCGFSRRWSTGSVRAIVAAIATSGNVTAELALLLSRQTRRSATNRLGTPICLERIF